MGNRVNRGQLDKALLAQHRMVNIKNATEPRMSLYSTRVQEFLTADNSFLQYFTQDGALAQAGANNVIPQSVGLPSVQIGARQPNTLNNGDPANKGTVTVRRNDQLTYPIEYFSTDPQVVDMPTDREVAYNKTTEMLKAHSDAIMTARANYALVEVQQDSQTSPYIVPTTGANRPSEVDGTTPVKAITYDDLVAVKQKFIQQNVFSNNPNAKIYAVISPAQWADIVKIENVIRYDANSRSGDQNAINSGVIGNVLGIDFMFPRQNTEWQVNMAYDVLTTPGQFIKKPLGSVLTGASDTGAALFFCPDYVWKAEASPRVYSRIDDPEYYGSIYAIESAFGATRSRLDDKGVVMLSESL